MTEAQYIQQNSLGFEGDLIAREKFKHIIESNGINTIVETGTFLGSTTKWLSQWVDKVYTIEVNKKNFDKAKINLDGHKNVTMFYGNSAEKIKEALALIAPLKENSSDFGTKPVFFFLDAHWESYNPLLKELEVIKEFCLKPFIAIHDFKVPGHPELGFDSYGGQDYEWSWIEKSVKALYGEDGFEIEYNSEASGAKRGIIYISPKI